MHRGKAQVGSTVSLRPRFNPGPSELNPGRRSNLGSGRYAMNHALTNLTEMIRKALEYKFT